MSEVSEQDRLTVMMGVVIITDAKLLRGPVEHGASIDNLSQATGSSSVFNQFGAIDAFGS